MPVLERPVIGQPDHDRTARAAVEALIAELQKGWDRHDAEIADRHVSADVIVAHVAGVALDASGDVISPSSDDDRAFSEMAMYVLVRRDDDWWLAAGQNTLMRSGGAV